jgi:uncharacterized protein (UPF0210 family)
LTGQFRSENEILKEELSLKIQVEVQNLNESFNKLNKHSQIELINVQTSVESDLGRVEGRVEAHVTETRKQIDGTSEEVNVSTKTLMADIVDHRSQTEADTNAVTQQLVHVKEQLDGEITTEVRNVSNSLAEYKKQTESERQTNISEFSKVNEEINNLKARLPEGPTTDRQSVSQLLGQL